MKTFSLRIAAVVVTIAPLLAFLPDRGKRRQPHGQS
jgi:hypothetical protein